MSQTEESNDEEYAYPDVGEAMEGRQPFVPLALRRSGSISLPLSVFEVISLKY